MSKFFRSISGKEMVKLLSRIGFFQVSQKGSHIKVKRKSFQKNEILIIPDHKEIKLGTFRNILTAANVSIEEFDRLHK